MSTSVLYLYNLTLSKFTKAQTSVNSVITSQKETLLFVSNEVLLNHLSIFFNFIILEFTNIYRRYTMYQVLCQTWYFEHIKYHFTFSFFFILLPLQNSILKKFFQPYRINFI